MKSKWFEYKEVVIDLRKKGYSMTTIERQFGIPRSTLSGWFKTVTLTEEQRTSLMKSKSDGWKRARENAVKAHNLQKQNRIDLARSQAVQVFESLPLENNAVLELALAMLYFGEGSKKNATALGASDPKMILFFIKSCEKLYGIDRDTNRYDLHLRFDQDEEKEKAYWAKMLHIDVSLIKYASYDMRTVGKPTRSDYHGVCQVKISSVAIQRRLIALYNVYCSSVNLGT